MRTMPAVILLSAALIAGCATYNMTPEERAAYRAERAAIRAEKIRIRNEKLANDPSRATPPEHIKPLPTSPLIYAHLECREIAAELESLGQRETELVSRQRKRAYGDTAVTRFAGLGVGIGDGADVENIALVRGKREAAIVALEKKCSFDAPEKKAGEAPGLQGASDAPPMQTTP